MSPEIFLHNNVSPALDIYSLGIIRESAQGPAVAAAASQLAALPLRPHVSRSDPCAPAPAVHMMCAGKDPFAGQTPAMTILLKAILLACPPCRCAPAAGRWPGWPEWSVAYAEPPPRLLWAVLQVRAQSSKDRHLPEIEDVPQALRELVHDCTHHERRRRPSAEQVVQRLEALLEAL